MLMLLCLRIRDGGLPKLKAMWCSKQQTWFCIDIMSIDNDS